MRFALTRRAMSPLQVTSLQPMRSASAWWAMIDFSSLRLTARQPDNAETSAVNIVASAAADASAPPLALRSRTATTSPVLPSGSAAGGGVVTVGGGGVGASPAGASTATAAGGGAVASSANAGQATSESGNRIDRRLMDDIRRQEGWTGGRIVVVLMACRSPRRCSAWPPRGSRR
jgi:hypothetical protein